MSYCADCGKRCSTIRCNRTGWVERCDECDALAEERYGIKREFNVEDFKNAIKHYEFKPYVLRNGPIYSLPDNWKGIASDKNSVKIESRAHEAATFDAMNCHIGEKGEKVRGHTIYNKGNHTSAKIYSFVGRKGANTCH